jgi:two-component system, sensor histidine kinase
MLSGAFMDAADHIADEGTVIPPRGEPRQFTEHSLYQIILQGFIAEPLAVVVSLAITTLAMALLGHVVAATVQVIVLGGVDLVSQRLYRRWRKVADQESQVEVIRLGLLVCTRNAVAIAGLLYVALVDARPVAMDAMLLMTTVSLLVTVTQSCFSSRLFTMATFPQMAALLTVLLSHYAHASGMSVLLLFGVLALVLWLIAVGAEKARDGFIAAQAEKDEMIRSLEAARDAAQAGEQAKATFLATMSHEIRTPMNGVLGMAQVLKNSPLDPAQTDQINTLIQSGEFLMSILNDILDLSKIEAGRMEAAPEASDLHALLRHLAAFWTPRAQEKSVALNIETAANVPQHVMLDPVRVRQILFNLIGNALKFTERGAITVMVDGAPMDDGRFELHVTVADTGVGIAADDLPLLFSRFSQVDDSNARRFGGTGLGLAISSQLAELMDGCIRVESELGKGSTFHVVLPLALAGAPAAEVEVYEDASDLGHALSVLAVDDNPVNLSVVTHLLQAVGHRVSTAPGGHEALAALADQRFDLILMDIQMPEMTGPEVLDQVRRCAGPNLDTPAIALTADAMTGGEDRYRAQGFQGHVTKPIQPAVLLAAISAAMAEAGPANAAAVA